MSTRRRFLGWGVFLVCLGAVPLAARLGLIDAQLAAGLLRLWPLIIVGIGLSLVLRWTPYGVVGSILAGAITGIVLGVALAGGVTSPAVACAGGAPASPAAVRTGTFDGPAAEISARLTCGHLTIARGAGPDWSLAATGPMPLIEADRSSIDLRSATAGGFALGGTDEHWQLTLPAQTAIAATIELNAASGDLAFGPGAVDGIGVTYNGGDGRLDLRGTGGGSGLSTTLNAGSLKLLLPSEPINASITLNASSLTLCVLPESALRISYTNTLGSDNFAAAGLQGGGEDWSTAPPTSPASASGTGASTLHITSNLSSISVDRTGECS